MAYGIGIALLVTLLALVAPLAFAAGTEVAKASTDTADRRIRIARTWRRLTAASSRYYLTALILVGGFLFLLVLAVYAWRLIPSTAGLLDRMQNLDTAGNAEAARNIAFAVAAFAGMLAVLATVPFRLVRAWIAERTARVAESNLTTDLINRAVEGLGAEKTVSRIGRPVSFADEVHGTNTAIQWQGDSPPGVRPELGQWQSFDRTEPKLEVRIGAIYTLERIARENPEEHIRVMEILCAYIRENAPARDARPNLLEPFPDYPEMSTAEDLEARHRMRADRQDHLAEWTADLRVNHAPRTDIQTALEVIGRRSKDQTAREGKPDAQGNWTGYRLDLRRANLQAADLADRPDRQMQFRHARLDEARMEGAFLTGARMERAHLRRARLEATDLSEARMEGAVLMEARMEGAYVFGARMEGVNLSRARMEGADLIRARMEGANLSGADLRSVEWGGAETDAPVHSADLRGAKGLNQEHLDAMIGNCETLLPETLDDGSVPSIPSCWATPPRFFEAMVARQSFGIHDLANDLRTKFLCPKGVEPPRTGTPLALDAPYPDGHPLARRKD